jgi:hypothetical protein
MRTGWCPSWADDAGYADTWTDEDEAPAVAEANALWAREQAEQAQRIAPARTMRVGLVDPEHHPEPDPEASAAAWPRRRPRWWFHAALVGDDHPAGRAHLPAHPGLVPLQAMFAPFLVSPSLLERRSLAA